MPGPLHSSRTLKLIQNMSSEDRGCVLNTKLCGNLGIF